MNTFEINNRLGQLQTLIANSDGMPEVRRAVAKELRRIANVLTMSPKESELDKLRGIYENQGKIPAIKHYREEKGGAPACSLYDAKTYIETMAREHKWRECNA